MKKRIYFKIVLITVFIMVLSFQDAVCAQSSASSDAVEQTGSGTINWTTGMLTAKGSGAPRPDLSPAQSRLMAERAAKAQAYSNLLEVFKGVQIDSTSVVENYMTKSDVIKTRIQGIIRGAMPVEFRYMSDGACEVTMAMPLKGALLDVVVPQNFGTTGITTAISGGRNAQYPENHIQPPTAQQPVLPSKQDKNELKSEPGHKNEPIPDQQKEKKNESILNTRSLKQNDESTLKFNGGKATGIVIDGRGLGLKPALLPKIFDPQGGEVYVGRVVTRTNAVEQGVAGYAKDVNAAANNFRVTDNPAIIKALRTSGAAKTDIVIGQADAQALRTLSSKDDFLQYCRVIIVY